MHLLLVHSQQLQKLSFRLHILEKINKFEFSDPEHEIPLRNIHNVKDA